MTGIPRTEPCACGGVIHALPDGVLLAVRVHNLTAQHRAWRRRREVVLCSREARRRLRRDVEYLRIKRWARGAA